MQQLFEDGRHVHLATDAQAAQALARCDHRLLGADAWLPDGGVWNKTGSATLAVVAGAQGVPVACAAETSMVVPAGVRLDVEEQGGAAVWPDHPGRAADPTFESVRGDAVAERVCERGPWSPREVAEEAVRAARRLERNR